MQYWMSVHSIQEGFIHVRYKIHVHVYNMYAHVHVHSVHSFLYNEYTLSHVHVKSIHVKVYSCQTLAYNCMLTRMYVHVITIHNDGGIHLLWYQLLKAVSQRAGILLRGHPHKLLLGGLLPFGHDGRGLSMWGGEGRERESY